jgi:hypothetical protein
MEAPLTPAELKAVTGISASYAHMILSGERTPGMPLAIAIFRKLGRKFGPIAQATDEEIDVLERVQERAA